MNWRSTLVLLLVDISGVQLHHQALPWRTEHRCLPARRICIDFSTTNKKTT